MTKSLSACFVGLGSIGKRHLTNLHAVAKERGIKLTVDALRHEGSAPLDVSTAPLISSEHYNFDDLGHYDLMFVCNPSQLHYDTLCRLKDNAERFFIEKPVFVKPLTDAELAPFDNERKFYVACPMRHTKTFAYLQDFIKTNRVFSARAICSSYLPEWRPNQDYRTLYSASKDSGGVKFDLVHEFDYIFTLFGFPFRHFLSEGKFSDLEISSNDTVAFIGEYPDKVIELHLDYHGRRAQRYIELYTPDDVVRCDFLTSTVNLLKSGKSISFAEDRNDCCRREIDYFLRFAEGTATNINTVRHSNAVIDLISKQDARKAQ